MRASLATIRRLLALRRQRRAPAPIPAPLADDLAYLVAAARGVC